MQDTKRRKSDFVPSVPHLSMNELVKVLVKHYGLPEGKYDLEVEFQIGTGPVGPNKDELIPGVVLGVKSIGIGTARVAEAEETKQDEPSPAAEVTSPKRASKAKKDHKS